MTEESLNPNTGLPEGRFKKYNDAAIERACQYVANEVRHLLNHRCVEMTVQHQIEYAFEPWHLPATVAELPSRERTRLFQFEHPGVALAVDKDGDTIFPKDVRKITELSDEVLNNVVQPPDTAKNVIRVSIAPYNVKKPGHAQTSFSHGGEFVETEGSLPAEG
jgi:hypothetical protein